MKKISFITFIGIIFLGLFVFAEDKLSENIESELILDKKFDEPVVDTVWDFATMTVREAKAIGIKNLENKKEFEKVKVKYPKVIVTKREIKFSDTYGKQKRSYPVEEAVPRVAHNQKYVSIYGWKEYPQKKPDITIHLFDNDGNKLWEKNFGYMGRSTEIIHCALSKEGKSIVFFGEMQSYSADIYDAMGNKIGRIGSGDKKDDYEVEEIWPDRTAFLNEYEIVTVGRVKKVNTMDFYFAVICFGIDNKIKWIQVYKAFNPKIKVLPVSNCIIVEYHTFKPYVMYLDIINPSGILIRKENLNEFMGVEPIKEESLKIEILEINEMENKIKSEIGYKDKVQNLIIDLKNGGKK